jgi:hypothetical protein
VTTARDIVARIGERQVEEAVFRGVDGLGLVAHRIGYATNNDASPIKSIDARIPGAD